MLIQKDYKFYAAHRNEELHDKCRNLHGHRYGVSCFFTPMGFQLQRLEVRETDSSVVVYTREDWVRDNRYFAHQQQAIPCA